MEESERPRPLLDHDNALQLMNDRWNEILPLIGPRTLEETERLRKVFLAGANVALTQIEGLLERALKEGMARELLDCINDELKENADSRGKT